MATLTKLEETALRSIFSETPELAAGLDRQLASAAVTKRRNTSGGFFTTISVAPSVPRVCSPGVLGYETQARVDGLEHGLGFVLFIKDGRLHLLEGYAWGPESTASFDWADLTFEIFKRPIIRPALSKPPAV